MSASISTASNVIIIGSSIVVPVDIQQSQIAYDQFNNAWIVEGTVEANITNGTIYTEIVNTPTVLATIEGQPIEVSVSNTPTVLATIEGQPISVNINNTPTVLATIEGQPISVNVNNVPTVLATIEGQPISVNVSNTPNVNISNVPTVLATIEGQPISVSVSNTPSVNISNTPTVLASVEGQPISVNVTNIATVVQEDGFIQYNLITDQTVTSNVNSTIVAKGYREIVVDLYLSTAIAGSAQVSIYGVEPQSGNLTSVIQQGTWIVMGGQRVTSTGPLGYEVDVELGVVGTLEGVYLTAELNS